jgi:hypothetical protein
MYDEDDEVGATRELAKQLADVCGKTLRFASWYYYKEAMSQDDIIDHCMTAAWIALKENPDGDVLKRATEVLKETSDIYVARKDYYRQNNNKRSIAKFADPYTSSYGSTIIAAAQFGDEQSYDRITVQPQDDDHEIVEYEETLASLSTRNWLSKLLESGIEPKLATAAILYYGHSYSIPKILHCFGITTETEKEFNSVRVKWYRWLMSVKPQLIKLLNPDEITMFSKYFGEGFVTNPDD